MARKLLLLPGDGVGSEVMAVARGVLERLGLGFEIEEASVGGAALDAGGHPLPEATLATARAADAVLLGAVGGPKWEARPFELRPEAALLALRSELGLFANLRPVRMLAPLIGASPLKPEIVAGLDLLIVRELTGGVYFGEPRGITELPGGERRGVNTQVYTTGEIRRVGAVAFDLARGRRRKVCSVEKSNVMESGRLWREEITRLHREGPDDLALSHMLADNCAMQLVRDPGQFDVIVTDNLFGDLLSDEAAMLTGSLGMLPSASLGAPDAAGKRSALYEPVHGSAPDIAGRGVANPTAMILSAAMMLRHSFALGDEAAALEQAVERALAKGARTADIARPSERALSTTQMGEAVIAELN